MKRPIELTVALVILFAEYLALLPSYLKSFVAVIKSDAHGPIMGAVILGLVLFVVLRPLALYLLWRGTSWVRTLIVWVLPIAVTLSLMRGMAVQTARTSGSIDVPGDFLRSLLTNAVSRSALIVGFFALLVLYLPRVGAWFRYMKDAHATRRPANI